MKIHENLPEMRSMTKGHFNDYKLDKSKELNASMSIDPKQRDNYEKTIKNIGGQQ